MCVVQYLIDSRGGKALPETVGHATEVPVEPPIGKESEQIV